MTLIRNTRTLLCLGCLVLFSIQLNSQQLSDEEQVKSVIQNYITNFFTNNYDAMEISLHDRLSKRGVNQNGQLSENFSKDALKEMMERNPVFPVKYQKNDISDIKIRNRVATAVLETGYPKTRWVEYIHLAKLNDKWIITDVFWCFDKIVD